MEFNAEKMYTYLKGYATAWGMHLTLRAMHFARQKHERQFRKSGAPYIVHPLAMACNAVSLGIKDDETIATILLHDVCEDCNVSLAELPVNDAVRHSVDLVTFTVMDGETKDTAKTRYYNMISQNKAATFTKLIDRCHNVSSMAGVFSPKKLHDYIDETREYILPLLRHAKDTYPVESDVLFILKYHINSVIDAIDLTLKACEMETAHCVD